MNDEMILNVKIQAIYFLTDQSELGITHATSEKRISIEEAKEILNDRKIVFEEILKVKYEDVTVTLPLAAYETYLVK